MLPPHVLLTSTRGIHGPQMSELAFLNMIALTRDFRKMQRNQAEAKWEQWGQPILEGKTIVIVGLGLLAEHLAERCKLFGMHVIGVSDGRSKAPAFRRGRIPAAALVKVAARADFLMLLVPYSKETHHLVNREVIAAMKPSAFLINLARGGVLDEAALIEHLQAGKIAGAGLDIFSKQPLPPDNPLWRMPNVIITPNIGGRSDRFVEQTMTVVEPNLQAFVDGRLKDLRESGGALGGAIPCPPSLQCGIRPSMVLFKSHSRHRRGIRKREGSASAPFSRFVASSHSIDRDLRRLAPPAPRCRGSA